MLLSLESSLGRMEILMGWAGVVGVAGLDSEILAAVF